MQGYDTTPARVPAISRTWEVLTEYRCCGENWGSSTNTVTLTRTPNGIVGMVDGEAVTLERAASLLEGAASTRVISEIVPTPVSMKACLGVSAWPLGGKSPRPFMGSVTAATPLMEFSGFGNGA